jgi:hypothetical protein
MAFSIEKGFDSRARLLGKDSSVNSWHMESMARGTKEKDCSDFNAEKKKVKGRKRKLYSASRYTLTSARVIKE